MTAGRGGEGGVLPALPESIPALGPSLSGLALASPAGAGPFLVEGERAFVIGNQRGPVNTVSIDGVPTVTGLDARLGTAANVVLLPGVIRRELVSSGGVCLETIVVAPTLPLVVIQWWREGGAAPERIVFELPVTAPDTRLERGREGIALTSADDRVVAVGASPAPLEIDAADPEHERIRVSVRPPKTGPFSLIIAAGSAATVRSAFAASAHLPAHARQAGAGPCEDGLTLATGVTELDDALAWARARLRGIVDRAVTFHASGATAASSAAVSSAAASSAAEARLELTTGLAALGVGDRDAARRALSGDRLYGTPAGALMAARFAASFGDAAPALKHARALLEAGRSGRDASQPSPDGHAPSLAGLALRALADGLRHAAPESMIAELREAASAVDTAPTISGRAGRAETVVGILGGRRLPVVGRSAAEASWPAWLATLLAGEPSLPAPAGPTREGEAVRRAGALFRTDPDAAWIEWRQALSAGLAKGPAGPGSWDAVAPAGKQGPDSVTAEVLLAFAHGLLGLDPDAPVGRIRIAPRLPSHLTRLDVRGITVGDTALRMEYGRSGATHVFTLEPEVAAVPPLVVFEPAVHGRVREIRVDGRIADLAARPAGSMTVAPVQIPVDAPRSVEILTE